jgi:two-component system capsular synthesis response regulator RcsB
MFEKVLIAEDHQTNSRAVAKTIQDLEIPVFDYVYYCDDAYTRIKKELASGKPYDLLITDISFIEDHRPQRLKSGIDLIKAARELHPALKIIIFSIEGRPALIKSYFAALQINGFVQKGRLDAIELEQAVRTIVKGQTFISPRIKEQISPSNSHQFTNYDLTIISLLAAGMQLKEIPAKLSELSITPNGMSSMEKRLNHIKTVLNFKKNEQLIAFCKDMGII